MRKILIFLFVSSFIVGCASGPDFTKHYINKPLKNVFVKKGK